MLENFIKTISTYLHECCMNPYLRYKSGMREYLEGFGILGGILDFISFDQNYNELGNLYSETENIKSLKETIIMMQYRVKELTNDLQEIKYPNTLSRLQTHLPGKVWAEKIKKIKDELLNVKKLKEQKIELEATLGETKKKVHLMEREIKDKQSTK